MPLKDGRNPKDNLKQADNRKITKTPTESQSTHNRDSQKPGLTHPGNQTRKLKPDQMLLPQIPPLPYILTDSPSPLALNEQQQRPPKSSI